MKRIEWLDVAKGLGIFLVVWGHFYATDSVKIWIYGFHMPLFFFLSGYTFQVRQSSLGTYIRKKSRNLLVPFFVFQAITALIMFGFQFIYEKAQYPFSWMEFYFLNGEVGFNSPLWFLVVLFEVEILFFCFKKYLPKWSWLVLITVIGLAILSTLDQGIRWPLGIKIIPVAFLFYWVGLISRERKLFQRKWFLSWWTLASCFGLYVLTMYANNYKIVTLRSMDIGQPVVFFIGALLGIFAICLLAVRLQHIRILSFYGKNSLVILCTHYYFLILYANAIHLITGQPAISSYPISITLGLTIFTFLLYGGMFLLLRKRSIAQYIWIR
ncbi:acyltransferase family protein [Listeria weihenstephanensis]|uniref:Acyltransferase family protein n=1 Tax=Listeria weihenstephanensis TaxID=1006155 RepID=A0A1S7FSP6_9LIST|nr:acyltransferase family protein [Listeria weihenstephanensis]AQY50389.1 hypothetical protein UE46_04660 [Listeria weihenstephanensis]MBC1501437.1 acyltransferase family protein [Listeria weihenstephanensis]